MTHRRPLPHRRHSITFEAEHCASGRPTRFQVSVGHLEAVADLEGHMVAIAPVPAEVFISGTKAGSEVEAVARDGAVLLSIALQYGVPLDIIRGAITREQSGAPSTIIGTVIDQIDKEQQGETVPQPTNLRREALLRDIRTIVEQEMKNAEGS